MSKQLKVSFTNDCSYVGNWDQKWNLFPGVSKKHLLALEKMPASVALAMGLDFLTTVFHESNPTLINNSLDNLLGILTGILVELWTKMKPQVSFLDNYQLLLTTLGKPSKH